jgi:2-keto-3-deoxy-L-rhamnonate aldolase RhmA
VKTKAIRKFREKLAADVPVYGLWVTLESPAITEMAVALGLDWVVIDAEHSHLDWKDIVEHIRATVRSDTVAFVRLVERDTGLIKRALDIGADGVAAPWIDSAEDLQELICDSRYPPAGRRGVGGDRATVWGQCFGEHTQEANEHVLVLPMIENVTVVDEMPAMCQLDGAEAFFFGPADFSATAGHVGKWEGPGVAEQIVSLKDTMRAAGKHAGVIATSIEDLHRRLEQGFRMIALGTDVSMLLGSLHTMLDAAGCDRKPATSLDPADGQAIINVQSRPPKT